MLTVNIGNVTNAVLKADQTQQQQKIKETVQPTTMRLKNKIEWYVRWHTNRKAEVLSWRKKHSKLTSWCMTFEWFLPVKCQWLAAGFYDMKRACLVYIIHIAGANHWADLAVQDSLFSAVYRNIEPDWLPMTNPINNTMQFTLYRCKTQEFVYTYRGAHGNNSILEINGCACIALEAVQMLGIAWGISFAPIWCNTYAYIYIYILQI